ncbi:sugar ABC transporter ATP-binding protein [Sediminibacillus massiliensis]|uniref:sugar ABC transporter ATP-binding protein n=1 Tax=Sediminibacillus massiliensis TaxID=1926277 RepID=UPI000988924E|nr:sugar ABC transporter ATP-binding protein [Sediminibacillus massiliensis]
MSGDSGVVTDVCLEAKEVSKLYPGTIALDKVNMKLYKGKVNVLIGENGAGKSTLMKIIAGVESPSDGKIIFNGKEVRFNNTREAGEAGIGIIHQELNLFPNLTVAENIFMAREIAKFGKINEADQKARTKEVLEKLEQAIDPNTLVGELRVGQQQIIEIAKTMIQKKLQILIMDEPTSSLSGAEVKVLFRLIEELKQQGVAIVYISHRMEEIMQIGDYLTILRDGKLVASEKVKSIDLKWIVTNMVGEERQRVQIKKNKNIGKEILTVKNLVLPRADGLALDNVSFSLHQGEILGIYGLLGAGRTELLESLMGKNYGDLMGEVFVDGTLTKPTSVHKQIKNGFAYIPEDRQKEGLVQTLSIAQNLTLSSMDNYTKSFHLVNSKEEHAIKQTVKDFFIKVSNTSLPIFSLSGGNQQKVVIGKAILTSPRILLLDEPTRGIDVSAKADVFKIVNKLAESGLGVILVSSELKEIIDGSNRVIVLSKGKLTGEFRGDEITEHALMEAATKV